MLRDTLIVDKEIESLKQTMKNISDQLHKMEGTLGVFENLKKSGVIQIPLNQKIVDGKVVYESEKSVEKPEYDDDI
jgi:hypothetical protein